MMPFMYLYERMAFEGVIMKPSKRVLAYSGLAALAIGAAVATGDNKCSNKSYDNNNVLVSDSNIERITNSAYQLDADVAYVSTNGRERARMQGHGTTFVGAKRNGRQYFITANHVVAPVSTLTNPMTMTQLGKQSEAYTINTNGRQCSLDVVRRNSDTDVAILRSREDLGLDKLCDFADTPLREGDFVYVSGFPLNIGRYLVTGTVGQVDRNQEFFLHSAAANPGFSGGPIYVLDRGQPKLGGIARFYRPDAQGVFGAVRPDLVKQELDEVLKTDRVYR